MSIKIIKENLKTNNFARIYYIFGEEEFLKNYYYSELKNNIVKEMPEFNVDEFDEKNFSLLDFTNSLNSYPVMSDKKFIGITNLDNSLFKKEFAKEFADVLKNVPDYCTVVFVDTYLKPVPSTNYLLKAVNEAKGIAAPADKPDIKNLAAWAMRHFKNANKTISSDDLLYFIEITDNDMLSLSNEIAKICNYVTSDVVLREDIDKLVSRSIDANRYEIANALYANDNDKLFDVVEKLYKQGIDDIAIANVFYKTFTDLWKARISYESRKTVQELASDFKLNPYGAKKIMQSAAGFSRSYLHFAINKATDLDIKLKSTPYNKKELLTVFIGELSNRREQFGKTSY